VKDDRVYLQHIRDALDDIATYPALAFAAHGDARTTWTAHYGLGSSIN